MVSTNPVLVTWFGKRRALAVAIGGGQSLLLACAYDELIDMYDTGGSGLGGLVIATVTRVVIEKHSLRIAFLVNGAICAAVLIPCIILMRLPPNAKPQNVRVPRLSAGPWLIRQQMITFQPFKPSLFRNPGYLSLVFWGIFIQFAYTGASTPSSSVLACQHPRSRPLLDPYVRDTRPWSLPITRLDVAVHFQCRSARTAASVWPAARSLRTHKCARPRSFNIAPADDI